LHQRTCRPNVAEGQDANTCGAVWQKETYTVTKGKSKGQTRERWVNNTGKTGGTLRRGWTIGNVTKSADGYTVEIINPTEYASYVEFGHRTRGGKGFVNGKFMMTISEQELEADAPRILEQKLEQFLKGVFNA
jgi:hypothetical protein